MKTEDTPIRIRFTCPTFRLNGEDYVSADVQARAKEKDPAALRIINNLIQIKSGIIEVVVNK